MILFATVLLALSGALLLLIAFDRRRGPEGPVGAHLVTGPLAIAQIVALAIGVHWQVEAPFGTPLWPIYLGLPGILVALTAWPIQAMEVRHRWPCRLGVIAAVTGGALAVQGAQLAPAFQLLGNGLVLATGLAGYAMLLGLYLHNLRQRVAVAEHDRAAQDDFRTRQAAWQFDEWQKLPASAELWQLIQFAGAFHPEVAAQCHARIAALPDLDTQMDALLRTDWAPHAMRYIEEHYPRSRAPLATALAPFLDRECKRWGEHLRGAEQPRNWAGNLISLLGCAAAVQADGGDLRPQIQRWHGMLAKIRGLEALAARTAELAKGKSA